MWPFERARPDDIVRVGQHAIEHWAKASGGLSLLGSQKLPTDRALQSVDILPALTALFAQPPKHGVTLLLESAWLPVVLVDVGVSLLRTAQLEALVRHRLGLLYDSPDDPVGWDVRLEHRAGDRHALGYGLPLRLKESLVAASEPLGVRWQAMLPGFSWGWQQSRAVRSWPERRGWWGWTEQDRTMLARVDAGRVTGLHPALARVATTEAVLESVGAEAARLGLDVDTDPVVVSGWDVPAYPLRASGRVTWVSLSPHARASSAASAATAQVRTSS